MADLIPVHAIYDGTTPKYFFRTSDVYSQSGGVGERVGIKKIKDEDLTGKEEIIPVKELLRTGQLFRLGVRYRNSAGKRKSARLLVRNTFMTKLFADNAPEKLEGLQYKVGISERGTIVQIGMIRRATSY